MAQINSASINAPGNNPRQVSEASSADLLRNEFNGVDVRDPWRKFTDDEWFNKLGPALTGAEAMEAEDVDEAVAVVAKAAVTGTMVVAKVAETKMPLATTNER